MMNKKKNIFILLFLSLLLLMTSSILSLYDNVKKNIDINGNQLLANYLDEDFQYFTLAMAKEVDPSYEILSFDETVPDDVKQQISNKFYSVMDYTKYNLENENNLVYMVKNTVSNTYLSNNTDKISEQDDKTKYNFYSKLSYDEKGDLENKGDLNKKSFVNFNIENLLGAYYDVNQNYSESTLIMSINNYDLPIDKIKINQPQNLEITYIVPQEVTFHGYISNYLNAWENYNGFSVATVILCSVLLALFIICYPIKIVEAVNPFVTVKKWKAEINICVLSFGIITAVVACMILTGYTLNGYLVEYINSFDISNAYLIVMIINFFAWFLTLLLISVIIFQIKYICVYGLWRFLKEDTIIGSFIRYLKRKLDMISEIDLSLPINKIIMKYVLINAVIIFVMVTFWGIGYIFVIIYTFFIFFWVKDKVIIIQKDYNRLLAATQELGKGNFEAEIDGDLGIFNKLKVQFNNIKAGFEKAVEEEIKSQNMKNELIGNVSHDLKTPLTCIKNYIVLLQDDTIDENTRHEYLGNLNQYANRLTTLIEDLFEVSKVNSGNIQLDLINLNIIALLEQTFAESEEALKTKNLIVIKKYDNHDIRLTLDGNKTYRIFENLFTNISKYAMINSRVYIEVQDNDDTVIIEFKNISETQMNFTADEIVERFVRGDKSRHETGSGLGLAIAKSFIEVQGGEFNIDIDGDLFKATIIFNKNM